MGIPLIAVFSLFLFVGYLALNVLSLRGFRQNYYKRSFYGEKLLMRDDLTDCQRDYLDYLVNHRSNTKHMLLSTLDAPKMIFSGRKYSAPEDIKELWEDPQFDEFARHDIKVWAKRNPLLTVLLFLVVAFSVMVVAISRLFRGSLIRLISVEIAYEKKTFRDFEQANAVACAA